MICQGGIYAKIQKIPNQIIFLPKNVKTVRKRMFQGLGLQQQDMLYA